MGRALRAVSFDRDTAQLMGIDSTRIIQLAFVISGILAGIAGVFLGIKYTLYPTLGSLVVKGFIASVIGGLGSLTGAVIGALLLGILETLLLAALGSGYSTIAVFAVMLVFLLIRPQGIAGSNVQEKAYGGYHTMNALVSNVLTQVFITLIAVSGIYVLTGLTGMFSLGQAAFMAIGSYVSGLLVIRAHVPFALAALLAVAGATLIGYVIGYPVVRLRRDYISLVTLGFGEAIAALLNRMTTLTGGASGLTGIPRLVGLPLAFVSAVLAIALAAFFKTSKYGRQCIALKGDELAAKAMGINVTRVKMIAFLLSVALTSYSGVLYAFYMSYVDPTGFGWKKSADWVIMVFFGGVNSLTGSTLGAFILSALPQALRGLQNYRYVIYAVLVLLILNFKPSGLLGEWELTPRNLQQAFAKLGKKNTAKKEG